MMSNQIQITQAKKMNIVHMMSRNGYDDARIIELPLFLEDFLDYLVTPEAPHRPIRTKRPTNADAESSRGSLNETPPVGTASASRLASARCQLPQCAQPRAASRRPQKEQRGRVTRSR